MSTGAGFCSRVIALAAKETLQIVRDRATLGMLIGVPLIQVLLFGFAIQLTPQSLSFALVTDSQATATQFRELLGRQSVDVQVIATDSEDGARRALRRGQVAAAIVASEIPVRVLVDGSDPVLASQARNVIAGMARHLSPPGVALGKDDVVGGSDAVKLQMLFNPELRTQPYLVSGLLGLILTMTMVMMSALSLARERERGTMEGLLTLGARPAELAFGKLLPYLILGALQGVLVLCLARLAFGIDIAGSWLLLGFSTLLFAVANLALGFLFSALAPAQMTAMQMTFFFFLPSSLLSGFMFPFSAMPQWAQRIGEVLPLTHFLRIARGLVLRAVDAQFVLHEAAAIAAFALLAALAAAVRCHYMLRGA